MIYMYIQLASPQCLKYPNFLYIITFYLIALFRATRTTEIAHERRLEPNYKPRALDADRWLWFFSSSQARLLWLAAHFLPKPHFHTSSYWRASPRIALIPQDQIVWKPVKANQAFKIICMGYYFISYENVFHCSCFV